MASKVKKGFLYYIAWFLFIALGIVCIFATVLIFNPGKDVFGINLRYVNVNVKDTLNKVEINGSETTISNLSISDIKVTTGFSGVSIVKTGDYENITLEINAKIVGFARSENINYNVNYTYSNGSLAIDVQEPELWLTLAPNASITIIVPKEKSFAGIGIEVTTNSGSVNIAGGSTYDLSIKSLNVTTNSGKITLAEKASFTSGTVSLNSNSANIDVYSNISTLLNIETISSKIFIDDISGALKLTANESKVSCNKISNDVYFSSSKGYIYITELNGNFTSEPDKVHIANINITKMTGNLALANSNQSDIYVGELRGEALVNTTSGKVTIDKAYGALAITTTSGAVNVSQLSNSQTSITTGSGKIAVNFLYLTLANLTTEKADIVINLNTNILAKLNYAAKKNISVSWITTALELTGSILTPPATDATTNILNATTTTSGSIYVYNNFNQ